MVEYTIEIVTIAAVVGISAILTVYLSILKKNGWLGGENKFYRCPNQKCNRIFQKPIELKDLSETPARVYQACPGCGIDLQPVLHTFVEKKFGLTLKTTIQQKIMRMKIEDSTSKIETRKPEIVESPLKKALKPIETKKPQIAAENCQKPWNATETAKPTSEPRKDLNVLPKVSQKSFSPRSTEEVVTSNFKVKDPVDCPEGCAHFFGYLKSLPKGTMVPYECYSCRRMVDCYVQENNLCASTSSLR